MSTMVPLLGTLDFLTFIVLSTFQGVQQSLQMKAWCSEGKHEATGDSQLPV